MFQGGHFSGLDRNLWLSLGNQNNHLLKNKNTHLLEFKTILFQIKEGDSPLKVGGGGGAEVCIWPSFYFWGDWCLYEHRNMENHFTFGTVVEYWKKKKIWNMRIQSIYQLKLSKKNLFFSLFIKFLATKTKSIMSYKSLWICNRGQILNLISVIIDLIEVRIRFNAEKVLSDVSEVTGIVKYTKELMYHQ